MQKIFKFEMKQTLVLTVEQTTMRNCGVQVGNQERDVFKTKKGT